MDSGGTLVGIPEATGTFAAELTVSDREFTAEGTLFLNLTVGAAGGATVFHGAGFAGTSWTVGPGVYDINDINASPIFNDAISSIALDPGFAIEVAQHGGGGGARATYTDSQSNLGAFDNMISWFRVFQVSDPKVNRAPVLDVAPSFTFGIGQDFNFAINANDPEGDMMTFSAANLPEGVTLSPVGTIVGAVAEQGIYGSTIFVYDSKGGSDSKYVTWNICDNCGAHEIAASEPVDGPPVAAPKVALADDGIWKFLDDGSDLGTDWRDPAYDDRLWPMGHAKFGYGAGDEATELGFGDDPQDKVVTTYFRTKFYVADVASIDGAFLDLTATDGAAVYLNGTGVGSLNLPAVFDASTHALSERAATPVQVSLDVNALVSGENVLAVEIHQAAASGLSVGFDAELTLAELQPTTLTPGVIFADDTSAILSYDIHGDGGELVDVTLFVGRSDQGPVAGGWDM